MRRGNSPPYLERNEFLAEFTNVFLQQIAANQNAVFSETPVSGSNCIVHRDGSGIITPARLDQPVPCRYKVVFGGNIAIPTGGTAGPISVAIAVEEAWAAQLPRLHPPL